MKIPIKKYYASEIDVSAMKIGRHNFKQRINYLGSVCNIDLNQLYEIGPIDLLLGASPCNELSAVNPARKGLYGEKIVQYF